MGNFAKYPYLNFSDYNLDWIIRTVKEVNERLNVYVENSVITFADPITWDITEQYTPLTVVVDSDGTAYLSKQPVPTGIDISNTNYWLPIFNYDDNINQLRAQIAYNAGTSPTTTVNLSENDLVFWNGLIYRVMADMTAGSAFIIDTNIEAYTVDRKFGMIEDHIDNVEGDVTTLQTDLQNLSDRVDELDFARVYVVPEDYGAAGDGTTDDTAALQRCFDLGRPVYMANNYAISNTLTYSGPELCGNGLIIVGSLPSNKTTAVRIQSDTIVLNGIRINANNHACIGFWISATRDAIVKSVTVSNTQTTYYAANSGSVGIFIDGCSKAEISQCYIYDINRTTGIVNVHSSAAIVVYARNNIYVHDNLIERVKSSISYYDCDGIYVTYIDEADATTAVIENNKIIDCTGRFIKSQCKYTKVTNNYCEITYTFTPNDRYFNCVSIQRGSFEVVNNYFDLAASVHRNYTRCISLEVYDSVPRTGIIKGNTILSTGTTYPNTIRDYVYVVSDGAATNEINLDITDNIFTGTAEGMLGLAASYAINGMANIQHNKTNMYQVIDMSNSTYSHFDKLFVDCRHNNNDLYPGSSRLSNETAVFTKLRYRYNTYLNEAINNYPIDYDNLPIFEGYYRGLVQQMQNLPSAIARGDYLFMIKSPSVTQFYSFADTSNGFILN